MGGGQPRLDGPPVRFLGMEIELRKGVYRVHQQSYIQSLLEKYPEEKGLGLSHIKTPEEEDHVTPQEVQLAQRQTGELLWLAGRTRPDISFAVSLMGMYATKRPKGVIGREVRAYLKTSLDLALEYGRLPDGDFGEGGSQRRARHENLIEVYTDASYASSGLKSISGVVGFYAGAPVFWITCRQSFVTLSTAEAELMSMLEGLTALRCVKSVVSMVQSGPLEGRMYSDSTAGISIVSGTTGSWRTRHLKIRAQGLHEAVDRGETTLEHQPGKLLVADGMTKQLQGMLLRHFIQALKMTTEKREVVAVKRLCEGGDQQKRLQDALALLVVSTSIVMASAEGTEIEPTATNEDGMSWIFLMVAVAVILVVVAVILVVVDMVSRFGIDTLRRWISREEPGLLMHELASVPTRGTEGSAGLDLTTVEEYRIPSGEYMLVRTGIAVELPHGTYGRMVRGIEVGGGVIDRDFRGEIKVLIHNLSPMEFWIRSGDRVAQLIVEKVMEVRVEQVDALSTTTRVLTGPEWTNSRDAGQGITSFSVRRLGEVRQLEQSQDGGSSSQEPAPAAPQPVGTTAHEGGRDTLTEPTSLSQTSTLQSPLTMTPPTFMPREMTQPSSTSQESSMVVPSMIPRSPKGKFAFAESLKNRRCSKPIPPTATGFLALCGETGHGPPDVFPDYYLPERQWYGSATRTMETMIIENGIGGGYWPLEWSDDLWTLVTQRPLMRGPDITREFKLSSSVDALVRIHSTPRQKLYDFEDTDPNEKFSELQLTIAWLLLNQKAVVCSRRRGRRAPYLPETWTGYTIHLRISSRA